MNRYALILPLVVLSFLLGYFSSCMQNELVYVVAIVTVVFGAVVGYVLFFRPKKEGNGK